MKRVAPIFWLLGSFLILMSSLSNPLMVVATIMFMIGSILALIEK